MHSPAGMKPNAEFLEAWKNTFPDASAQIVVVSQQQPLGDPSFLCRCSLAVCTCRINCVQCLDSGRMKSTAVSDKTGLWKLHADRPAAPGRPKASWALGLCSCNLCTSITRALWSGSRVGIRGCHSQSLLGIASSWAYQT